MIMKTQDRINRFLHNDKDFTDMESQLLEYVRNIDLDDFLDDLIRIENRVMEQAYLEGYKDGLEKKTKENIMENLTDHIDINQIHELLDSLEIKPGR